MIADAILVIIFTSIAAITLLFNEDKIQNWANSKQGKKN